MIKRISILLLSIIAVMCLSACSGSGKTSDCNVAPIESDIYTQEDYEEACEVVFDYFKEFKGCSMTNIRYAGDDWKDSMDSWAEEYGAYEVIILESDFTTDSKGGDGSLDPNSTYTDWQWILARDKDGRWKHKDHGYG